MIIDLHDGKYTYVINDDGHNQHALRYGEPWRDLVGDGFVLAMAQKIEELESGLVELRKKNAELEKSVSVLHKQIETMLYNQPIRDLEQQAKGIESAIDPGDYVSNDWLLEEVILLREQAEQLKSGNS